MSKERLVELMKTERCVEGCEGFFIEECCNECFVHRRCIEIADYLLANGVIVPPCKVGDKVYLVGEITRQIVSLEVVTISVSANDVFLHLENGTWISCNQHIGKTVFLTREEAEKALAEIRGE